MDDTVEGLRKAARRVFWEAKKIDDASQKAGDEAFREVINYISWEADNYKNNRIDPKCVLTCLAETLEWWHFTEGKNLKELIELNEDQERFYIERHEREELARLKAKYEID